MKVAYLTAGWSLVALATIGIFVPLLPTTPFLLLASTCFSRSDRRYLTWLERAPLFGRYVHDWHQGRGVRRSAKFLALGCLSAFGAATILTGGYAWSVNVLLLFALATGAVVVVRLPPAEDHNWERRPVRHWVGACKKS